MYQAGYDKGIVWQPDGGNPVPINVTGWTDEDGADTPEVTHTGTNAQQAFIAAIKRCPCTFTANLDGGQSPKSIGITGGAKGTLAYTTITQGVAQPSSDSLHVIIEKVSKVSTVNGVVNFTVTAKSDAINASGQVVNSINIS